MHHDQGLPLKAIDQSIALIDRLNARQAIDFSIAYSLATLSNFWSIDANLLYVFTMPSFDI